jgi:hypothetical protein
MADKKKIARTMGISALMLDNPSDRFGGPWARSVLRSCQGHLETEQVYSCRYFAGSEEDGMSETGLRARLWTFPVQNTTSGGIAENCGRALVMAGAGTPHRVRFEDSFEHTPDRLAYDPGHE